MTLQQRIQESAAELGRLLRQAEKQHRRFLKRRDAKMQSLSSWTPEGHHLHVVPDHVPIHIYVRGLYATTVHKAQAAQLEKYKAETEDSGRLIPKVETSREHQAWVNYIYDAAYWQLALFNGILFDPVWRNLRFRNCPFTYAQALSVYNSAFQQHLSAPRTGSYTPQTASNR